MVAFLRRVVTIAGLVVLGLIVLVVVAISLRIPIDLDRFRGVFETLASQSLQREVRLSGDLVLVPTWSLTVEAGGLSIANPPTWSKSDFAMLELVRVRVDILPLLLRRLEVAEITAENGTLELVRDSSGEASWELGKQRGAPADDAPTSSVPSGEPAWMVLLPNHVTLEEINLQNLVVRYADAIAATEHELVLEELTGTASTSAPLELRLRGTLNQNEVSASVTGGDPQNLIGGAEPWPMAWSLDVGGTRFGLEALVDEHDWGMQQLIEVLLAGIDRPFASLEGRRLGRAALRVEGERLEGLGPYLAMSLPPWGPYRFEARFEAFGGGRLDAAVECEVGGSALTGELTLDRNHEPPRVTVSLVAPTIQLTDFALGDWSAFGDEPAEGGASQPDESAPAPRDRPLLSSEIVQSLDATLDVRVDRVAYGEDRLGAGKLEASLRDGRLELGPLQIDVAGGRIAGESTLEVTPSGTSAALRWTMRRFDYGILARRAKPGTDMAGLLAMEVDLRASAPSGHKLMQHASGRFDVAVFPDHLAAGIIDLWAVNLAAAALPAVAGDESKVNCMVVMMDMENGVMSEHTLLVDTSRITVHGRARFDFGAETVELTLAPVAKRPEFFSAATPVHIEGSFDDFDLDVRTIDVLGTVARVLTSPVSVPIRRVFSSPTGPQDAETCMAAVQRE